MLFLAAVLYAWEDFLNACVVQSRASKVVEVTKRFSRTSLKSKLEFGVLRWHETLSSQLSMMEAIRMVLHEVSYGKWCGEG